jgi:hypothetical protein
MEVYATWGGGVSHGWVVGSMDGRRGTFEEFHYHYDDS